MNSFNPYTTTVTDEERSIVKKAFSRYIKSYGDAIELEPEVCVYYDAWSNDNDGDPILSLIYEITKTTAQSFHLKKSANYVKAISLIVDFFTGKNTADFVELMQQKDFLAEMKTKEEIHNTVAEFLDSLLPEQGNRLIVFIDELDRCRPEYAVRHLERIKHYFSNDRITFVFSVNLDELQHTIKRYYGEGFDALRYLDRFFDYRIALPPANMSKFYQEIGLAYEHHWFDSVCKSVIDYCGFGLREIGRFYQMANIAVYKPTHEQSYTGGSDASALYLSLILIVPVIIGLHMYDMDMYNEFITGKNPQPLLDIAGDEEFAEGLCSLLLEHNETFATSSNETKTTVSVHDKLISAYYALFNDSRIEPWITQQVGKCVFSKRVKDKTLLSTGVLSHYATFE